MKKILAKLTEHQKLSREEARNILINVSAGKYNNEQIAAFLTVYLMRAISVEELQGFRDALLELCIPVDLSDFETIDMCGTGGDGKNTFNISTLATFIVAGAGYKVAKHGNTGVSSVSGSSNVMMELGYQFTNNTDVLRQQIDQCNICFLHAPLFHPAMKGVAPIRRALGVKTFFNMLGPMVNPSRPKHQLVGVFNLSLLRLYNYIYQQSGRQYVVLHSLDGYDEVSLTGAFKIASNGTEHLYQPADIGQPSLQAQDLYGGNTVTEAANIFYNILRGKGTRAQKAVVCTNAGLAIRCFKPKQSIADCIAEAHEALKSGRALQTFSKLVDMSR